MLAWVLTVCWVLRSRLTYFWRNMNISSIFYFSKSTSINTQYSSLWDTLEMMLSTKYLIKWKRHGWINWKFWYRFNLISSTDLDIKRYMFYLSNAPLMWKGMWAPTESRQIAISQLMSCIRQSYVQYWPTQDQYPNVCRLLHYIIFHTKFIKLNDKIVLK